VGAKAGEKNTLKKEIEGALFSCSFLFKSL
jgi:hypothetical protein